MKHREFLINGISILLIVLCLLGPHVYAICDFDNDGACDVRDIDLLTIEIENETHDNRFDLTGNSLVDEDDRAAWLSQAASENGFMDPYLYGDADLNGAVNAGDLMALGINWQATGVAWSGGNFWHGHDDGAVNARDLNALALNWQKSTSPAPSPVPEPAGLITACLALLGGIWLIASWARN